MSIKTIKNGNDWMVREGYEKIPNRFDPDNFLSDLNGKDYTLIKENRVRSVISMSGSDISEKGIYIKYFKKGDYKDYIKHLFVPTKARTEWMVANALLGKGVNTALPLAISEGNRSLLMVTETVTNSEDFLEFCQDNLAGNLSVEKESEKIALLNKLALFIRDIHEKGFCHYDLHAGNILIKFKKEHTVSDSDLYLMDLHRVKIFKNMSTRKRIFNLAQIFNSLSSIMTMADKENFIRSYGTDAFISNKNEYIQSQKDNHPIAPPSQGGERGVVVKYYRILPGAEQSLIRQIDDQSSRIRSIHYRSRLKRCQKETSVFSRKRFAGVKIYYRKGYNTGNLLNLIEKHNNALVNNDSKAIIKRDSRTVLTKNILNDKTVRNVVVKQYRVGCLGCILKNIFRGTAGRKAWVAGNGLRVYGFKTPLPLALVEKSISGIPTGSYVIMEEVKDSLEMDRYILKHFNNQMESTLNKVSNHITPPYQGLDSKKYISTTVSSTPSKGGEKGEVKNDGIYLTETNQKYRPSREMVKKKRLFINDFAKTLGMMHNYKIFHHDLKTCNIMVKEKDGSFGFIFLDFDKVSFRDEITVRKRVKNLSQINLSTPRLFTLTDRLRFLNAYLDQCGIMHEKKNILRKIVNLSGGEKILYVSSRGDVTEDW
ncbi:hypothetical protein SCALIN_C07_0019 [Candidatus Scalindua japonica]|uniref:Uncharacterized protein n=1 Tax=Candidatus Scalindua japonica TaxID=1284222 RepID=A0A286TWD3_9BACT|nr:lipopolysaccharide kinase InaA family protein [Candidatus Scalindua japonica]GAX60208.1 hypothetical protein SCALIN_C07_0019 [Candidatus Scalindua japonica]